MTGDLLIQFEGVSGNDHADASEQPQARSAQIARPCEDYRDPEAQAPERD
ncbi:hypothetical protein ABIB06_000235 [Bradyrhizobium sp. LB8.2]